MPGQYKDLLAPEPVVLDCKQNTETSPPIESPTPTPIPEICALPSHSHSDRSLPPLPPKNILPPLIIPDNPLQIPSLPTEVGAHQQHQYLHQDTFSPINSPSIYPPTSRPTSSIGSPSPLSPISSPISPIGVSRSNSPSITNLSRLSVVRQRLAQIERNHSELSTQTQTSASAPVSPPSRSAWSRKEAVWYTPRPSPRSDTTVRENGSHTSYVRKNARRTETEHSWPDEIITDPLDNILAQHGREPATSTTPQRDRKIQEGFEKASLAPLCQDLTKISKDLTEVKGVLGGASGYPTVHQMVVGLEHRAQGDGQTLRAIQDSLNSLGERVASVSAVQEQRNLKQQSVQGGATEDVLRLLENIQAQLSSAFPSIVGKLTQIANTQEQEKENQKQRQEEQVAYRNIGQTPSDTVEMETVLAKLEEIRKLCPIQAQADGHEGGDSTKPPEVGFSIFILIFPTAHFGFVIMDE